MARFNLVIEPHTGYREVARSSSTHRSAEYGPGQANHALSVNMLEFGTGGGATIPLLCRKKLHAVYLEPYKPQSIKVLLNSLV